MLHTNTGQFEWPGRMSHDPSSPHKRSPKYAHYPPKYWGSGLGNLIFNSIIVLNIKITYFIFQDFDNSTNVLYIVLYVRFLCMTPGYVLGVCLFPGRVPGTKDPFPSLITLLVRLSLKSGLRLISHSDLIYCFFLTYLQY